MREAYRINNFQAIAYQLGLKDINDKRTDS